MYKVNNVFSHLQNGAEYTIKGGWDGKYPDRSTCWLMRSDGTGHAYVGIVTPVRDVWNITEEEFKSMAGRHPEWFVKKA